jgi:hypothetical protein
MLRACSAFVALVGLVSAASAANPDPKSLVVPQEELSKARELVQKLGSDTYSDRETAERALSEMGRSARAALLDGVNLDADPEVRARAARLLPKANALEMKARLDTFLADTAGKYDHDLPGWHKLRAMVRGEWKIMGWTLRARTEEATDKAARELFIEFFQAPGGRTLMTAVDGPRDDLANLVATRKQELYNMRFPRTGGAGRAATVGEVAAVMFADALSGGKGASRTNVFTTVLSTSGFTQASQGTDGRAIAMRAILGAWIDTRSDPYEMYTAMNMATNSQNDAAAGRLAARLLGTAGAPAIYRGYAFTALIRINSKEHLPAIEKLIGDETMVTRMAINGKLQSITVGDMALAAAALLTGQKLETYHVEDRLKGSSSTALAYNRYSVPEDKRKEAAAKWKEWREKNP